MLEMTTSDSVLCLEDVHRYDRKCYLIAEQSGLLKHNSNRLIFLNDFNLWHFLRGKNCFKSKLNMQNSPMLKVCVCIS